MLSRIANSLFWMGRYLERAEHLARYSREQYISSLDAPHSIEKDVALKSILYMSGGYEIFLEKEEELTSENVFMFIACDNEHQDSIRSMVRYARENARSARNKMSDESWEAINKFYHNVNNASIKKLRDEQQYEFYQTVIDGSYIAKGIMANTLMRDEVWAIVNAGIHLEKAIQVNRMILAKQKDIALIESDKLATTVENYHWATLLRSTDCLDITRRLYKRSVLHEKVAVNFLVLNQEFPKSIFHNIKEVNSSIASLNPSKAIVNESVEFRVGKLEAKLKFMTFKEIEGEIKKNSNFLHDLLNELYRIATMFEQQYLSY